MVYEEEEAAWEHHREAHEYGCQVEEWEHAQEIVDNILRDHPELADALGIRPLREE